MKQKKELLQEEGLGLGGDQSLHLSKFPGLSGHGYGLAK
jgi:hypothetical protein